MPVSPESDNIAANKWVIEVFNDAKTQQCRQADRNVTVPTKTKVKVHSILQATQPGTECGIVPAEALDENLELSVQKVIGYHHNFEVSEKYSLQASMEKFAIPASASLIPQKFRKTINRANQQRRGEEYVRGKFVKSVWL